MFFDEITQWAHSIDLKDKSSATLKENFREYLTEVERQTGMKVKKLNVDGGREYKGQLTLILKPLGIKYEPTLPWTPECNRKVERVNRTLNNMIRAMLAQANMPNSFWAPAMKATAYLRNRLLRSALNDEIPYEHWSHGNSLQKKTSNYSNHLAASYMGQCSLPKDNRKKHCGNNLQSM